jgi:enterochelin esterase-like enzyme
MTPGEVFSDQVKINERSFSYRFMIYLPPCYDAGNDLGYPVIYMVPGRSGGPGDWFSADIDQIADQLILNTTLPPFMIVTTQEITSDPLAEDIYNQLIPYVDKHYNTLTDRTHRAVGGGSLGGIAAYRLAFQHPDDFASAGMFGSGVINGEDERVKTWLLAMDDENRIRVFLNTGEGDPLMLQQARVMASYLDDAGVKYQFLIGQGDHSYAYWITNMETYFLWVAEDW